jgi:hypothetical protein
MSQKLYVLQNSCYQFWNRRLKIYEGSKISFSKQVGRGGGLTIIIISVHLQIRTHLWTDAPKLNQTELDCDSAGTKY